MEETVNGVHQHRVGRSGLATQVSLRDRIRSTQRSLGTRRPWERLRQSPPNASPFRPVVRGSTPHWSRQGKPETLELGAKP